MSVKPAIPRGVWVLGLVSLLMDVSSELIHSLLPVFMVSSLGASMIAVGVIEGVAEATALIVKVFSGALSDWMGRRKPLALAGYGMAALTKPLFALATSVGVVFTARFIDRIGKGIRGAPRDALIADLTPQEIRGAAYGLRQSLDTVGAFAGPLLAVVLMVLWAGDFRPVFWVACVPAALAVLLLAVGVQEPESPDVKPRRVAILWNSVRHLNAGYWWIVVIGAVFTLARFSEAFLVLRGQHLGIADMYAPLVFVAMNVVYAAAAYPAGVLADRLSRRGLLFGALACLFAADMALSFAGNLAVFGLGLALWGLHLALSQGLLAAMVADAAPAELRGTAFGFFNLACGIAMLPASIFAGFAWDRLGPASTFHMGAIFAAAAALLLAVRPTPKA